MLIGADALQHWYEIAGIILAVPVALGVAWAIFRGIGHVQRVHEAIIGRPATSVSDEVPSIIERFHGVDDHLARQDATLAKQDYRLLQIEGEFRMNSGGSLKDDVVRLNRTVEKLASHQASDAGQARSEVSRVRERDDRWGR
jgi:hypothetical protein